ncbi:MAG: patatin family protein [Bacilli bacterium]|jgi:predicted patatin/cPLA2 family phospholipase|nr:patatin family protein [Bacilli bacterium]
MAKNRIYSGLASLPKGQVPTDIVTPGCLVLEGGAFRGVYTSGVLDYLMQQSIAFETTVGVSAGSLNGLTYVAGQIGRAGYINLRYRHDSRYVGAKAVAQEGGVIGFDYLFKGKASKDIPLATEAIKKTPRKFYAVITNVKTGKEEYREIHDYPLDSFYKILQASSSMPFFSRMVPLEGSYYLDGGCACKIAYQWAINQQFKKIVVVRTRESGFRKALTTKREIALYKLRYGKYKEFTKTVCHSNEAYNQQCDEIQELGKEGRIFVIAPSKPVMIERLEGDMEKLGDLYWEGYHDAEASFAALKDYLAA